MKYLKPYAPLYLLILLATASLGCGLTSRLGGNAQLPEEPPTRTPFPTFTPTPNGGAFIEVAVVDNQQISNGSQPGEAARPTPAAEQSVIEPTPTATLIVLPTDTPIPTPSAPSVTLVQNMNVRSGPGTGYPIIGAGPAGESANIVGRNGDASWIQVEFPSSSDGTGWVFAALVQLNGDVAGIAVAQVAPPPPPPPTPTPVPQVPAGPVPTPKPEYQFKPLGFYGTPNAGIVHFKGRIKTEDEALVNGYSVLVDNGAWSVVSHPTGASHHYPEKGDGEWDVVIPNIASGIGWWWLTVVKYECPDFLSRFDAQCKQFTRLSEDVKMEVVYPDKMVINADWICRKNCDQGLYVNAFRR